MNQVSRRRVLASVGAGAGAIAVAGCTGFAPDGDSPDDGQGGSDEGEQSTGTPGDRPLPEECPTTQDIGVEPPSTLDTASVASFVESYEHHYAREVVVEYEPSSRLDSYGLGTSLADDPREVDGPEGVDTAYEVVVRGGGAIYTPHLLLEARAVEPSGGRETISVEEVDDGALSALLEEAADAEDGEDGEGDAGGEDDDDPPDPLRVGPGSEVDRYLGLFESLSDDVQITGPGDSATLYFEVEDTPVELSVSADRFHGDYGWSARYYVDEHVVRRSADRETDPREGELLECRE